MIKGSTRIDYTPLKEKYEDRNSHLCALNWPTIDDLLETISEITKDSVNQIIKGQQCYYGYQTFPFDQKGMID